MNKPLAYSPDSFAELEALCDRGHVVLVQSREDGQLYVRKQLRCHSPEVYQQLMEEPVTGMPTIRSIHQEDGQITVIEEYIPGRTLAEVLVEEGPLPEQEILAIGTALCGILRELHRRKPAIIHRDIKPENVIRQPDGRIVLLDLSAAKSGHPRQTRDTVLIGTAGYAAPEQYGFSSSTPQTDLYALGVLLNVLATGALPWEKRAGGRLKYIIGRCLKLDPKDRFADVQELRAALKRAGREQIPWLLPGFRSLRWYKMIPASAWYLFIFWFALSEQVSTDKGIVHVIASRSLYAAAHLFPTLFYGDYLHIQRFFPFMRSHHRALRILGLVIAPFLTLFLSVLVYLTVSAFVYATQRALMGY